MSRWVHGGCLMLWTPILAGCQGAARVETPDLPLAQRLEFGFDLDSEDTDWRTGDRVVYELATCDGRNVERFYLRYRVLDRTAPESWPEGVGRIMKLNITGKVQDRPYERAISTPVVPAELQWLDADGQLISSGGIVIAFDQLNRGLFSALRSFRQGIKKGVWAARDDTSYQAGAAAFTEIGAAVVCFQKTFEQRPSHRILRHVTLQVIRPSLLQLLAGMRGFTLRWGRYSPIAEPTMVAVGDDTTPGMRCAISHELGSNPVSIAELQVIDTTPPWHLCGGVVSVDGRAIAAPQRTNRARVVAIRRGPNSGLAEGTWYQPSRAAAGPHPAAAARSRDR